MRTIIGMLTIALSLSLMVSACGNGSSSGGNVGSTGGAIQPGMTDAIQGYTEAVYQAQIDRFANYVCKQELDAMVKQVTDAGLSPSNAGYKYDLSGITFKVDSLNGDVAKLSIASGQLKVTNKDGKVLDAFTTIPGSVNGIVLKNEGGWKVCYSAK